MFKVGDKVLFGRPNGEKTNGTVIKVNPKKLKIRQDEVRGSQKVRPAGTVWTVPPSLCRHIGDAAETQEVEVETPKREDAEILRDIRTSYAALSPENIWCDGEATASQARATERRLRARLKEYFQELGREVSEGEAFGDEAPSFRASVAKPRPTFRVGDAVTFKGRNGATVQGTVRRVNRKTITVDPIGRQDGRYWRVSPHLLSPANKAA